MRLRTIAAFLAKSDPSAFFAAPAAPGSAGEGSAPVTAPPAKPARAR